MWHFLFLAFQWHRGKRAFVILPWRSWPFCCTRSHMHTERNGAAAQLRERFRRICWDRTVRRVGDYTLR
jgi:hypothetical protein